MGEVSLHQKIVLPLRLMDRGRDVIGAIGRILWPAPGWLRTRLGGGLPSAYGRYYGDLARRVWGILAGPRLN